MESEIQTTTPVLDDETRWQAVVDRDAAYIGRFVYAVRSTGVYCRPGCTARLPGRAQVVFFEDGSQAEAAGFRACKRCRPQEALSPSQAQQLVEKACAVIDARIEENLSLEALAREVGASPSHLHRLFKSVLGLTPHRYAAGRRLERFKSNVRAGQALTPALYEAGYGSSSRLYEKAPARLGMTPAAYRRGGQGMRIAYTITSTKLGRMLVAATERGVCAVSFGEDVEALAAQLRAEYPAAEITPGQEVPDGWVSALVEHLESQSKELALPLDLQATTFQLRVWEELRRIPYGETRTYTQVAEAIGEPKAVRAVASACAANPVVLIIPCHRVLRSDGSLGGYRYGLERKRKLLEMEREG
jgi:AraC family transcriptional regulator of adaptative response/methylated-DNA-[protein]-cysteine methyltransferase